LGRPYSRVNSTPHIRLLAESLGKRELATPWLHWPIGHREQGIAFPVRSRDHSFSVPFLQSPFPVLEQGRDISLLKMESLESSGESCDVIHIEFKH
jgi:hypothetical protein